MTRSHPSPFLVPAFAAGLLLCGPAIMSPASAALIAGDTLLVDLGQAGRESGAAGVAASDGNFWSNFALPANDNVTSFPATLVADLVRATDGIATGASLVLTTSDFNSVGIGGVDNPDANDTNALPESAARDTFFFSAASNAQSATFQFQGLDPTLSYDLSLFGSVPSGSRPLTIFTVAGTSASYQPVDNGETGTGTTTADFTGLTPDSSGTLSFVVNTSAGGSGHLNAIELTAVPEPGSLLLLAASGALITTRQRRD